MTGVIHELNTGTTVVDFAVNMLNRVHVIHTVISCHGQYGTQSTNCWFCLPFAFWEAGSSGCLYQMTVVATGWYISQSDKCQRCPAAIRSSCTCFPACLTCFQPVTVTTPPPVSVHYWTTATPCSQCLVLSGKGTISTIHVWQLVQRRFDDVKCEFCVCVS